ncbi:MAG: hypothetical protein GWN93_21830 [Deltaproteobacteria bacterium]|nr:hypothetical protein [Deltaproteobacteria bacterium]
MVAHIYGRLSLIANNERPHMFIKELMLYIDHLREETKKFSLKLSFRTPAYFSKFKKNLLEGIEYYHRLAGQFIEDQRAQFLEDLKVLQDEIERLALPDVG